VTACWRTVSTGLRLVLVGAQVAAWSLAAAFAIGCGGVGIAHAADGHEIVRWIVVGLLFAALGAIVLGRVLCAVGRWVCMATPPHSTKARSRIRLTVIFETCGLLSGVATVALVDLHLPLPDELAMIGGGFWLLTTVIGRVCFFSFAQAVGESVGARTVTDDAKRMFRISLVTLVAGVTGPILVPIGNSILVSHPALHALRAVLIVAGIGLVCVAVAFSLFLFASHFMLTADLKRILSTYTPAPPDDDPDREYRERYIAGGGTDRET
jgi:hypothetical protein